MKLYGVVQKPGDYHTDFYCTNGNMAGLYKNVSKARSICNKLRKEVVTKEVALQNGWNPEISMYEDDQDVLNNIYVIEIDSNDIKNFGTRLN